MKDIPLSLGLLRHVDPSDYTSTETGRRFTLEYGEYVEVTEEPEYSVAEFGEIVLDWNKPGKHRLNRITIIYARILNADT